MSNELQAKGQAKLSEVMASKYGLDPGKFFSTLKTTLMKSLDGGTPKDEDVATFMIVSNKYDLDPFTKEIVAFPDKKGGIIPVVTIDGWTRIRDRHDFDGEEFFYSEQMVIDKDGKHKPCWEWVEIHIYQKGASRPVIVREYFDEVYVAPRKTKTGYEFSGPWQTHTKRMMRHKVSIQGYRKAFGISGIYDEDEYERIIDATTGQAISGKPVVQEPKAIVSASPDPEPEVQSQPEPEETPSGDQGEGSPVASEAQLKMLRQTAEKKNWSEEDLGVTAWEMYRVNTLEELTSHQAANLLSMVIDSK